MRNRVLCRTDRRVTLAGEVKHFKVQAKETKSEEDGEK